MIVPRPILAALCAAALPGGALADGAAVFSGTCAACHGEGGVGTPGLAPPLDRPDFWAGLGDDAPGYVAGVLMSGLTGRITAGGMDYVGLAMPAQSHLSDAEAAEVGTYVLAILGGQAGRVVAPETIAKDRATPLPHADLRALRKGG